MQFLPLLLLVVTCFIQAINCDHGHFRDFRNHKCLRECTPHAPPMECVYDFTLEYYAVLTRNCFNCTHNPSDCLRPHCVTADGVKRAIKTINRMLPGPGIQVCLGDTVVVNVENMMFSFESTSIHWHGIHIQSPNMDGVAMITQCPIEHHTKFQYRFLAPNPGTHWWHSHSSGQRVDGVFGSFIIRQANDPSASLYDYDLAEHVMILNDWMDETFINRFNAFTQDSGDELPNSILINGRGGDMTVLMMPDMMSMPSKRHGGHHGGKANSMPPPPPPPPPFKRQDHHELPRAEFIVAKGRRYRFRVINAGSQFCPLEVSIDKHLLTIIALDGNPVEPFQVASFFVLIGERVDFVLNANAPADSYWIKVKGHADCATNKIFQTAVLRYGTSNRAKPSGQVTYETAGPSEQGKVFNPFNVQLTNQNKNMLIIVDQARSIVDEFTAETLNRIRQPPNKRFYLGLDMNFVENPMIYDDSTFGLDAKIGFPQFTSPQINNITFEMPNAPLIYQYKKVPPERFCNQDERKLACPDDQKFCSCIHTLQVNLNDIVELIIVDGGSQQENHPVHLHGFSFAVLGTEKLGDSAFMPDIKLMDQMGKLKRNLDAPPLKDTVSIPSGGYTIVRFHANNPGVWMLHCHIEFHMELGMMLIFKVGQDRQLPPIDLNTWPQGGDFDPKKDLRGKNHHGRRD